jgi:hypothetical protein
MSRVRSAGVKDGSDSNPLRTILMVVASIFYFRVGACCAFCWPYNRTALGDNSDGCGKLHRSGGFGHRS